MTEHIQKAILPFNLLGIDLSISKPIVIMWGVVIFVFFLLFCANQFRLMRLIQEYIYDFIVNEIAHLLHSKSKLWFSFLITLFLFIFFNNVSGLLPGSESPTSNINVTASMAIMVFIFSQLLGIYFHGFKHFSNIIPSGIPKLLLIVMIPLEIISQLARPFSLAIRLFANTFAGHTVLLVFLTFIITVKPYLKFIPVTGVILISLFEIFIALIQAFIFTYLSSMYISETIKGHE